jgi:hypothetical protein
MFSYKNLTTSLFLGAGQPLLCQAAWQGNATVVKKLLVKKIVY